MRLQNPGTTRLPAAIRPAMLLPAVLLPAVLLPAVLISCAQNGDGIGGDARPFDAISPSASISLLGTEPFWNVEIEPVGETYRARYSTPDNAAGTEFVAARFAGNNGIGFSGEVDGLPVQIALTPGECSDAMSDRTYPYTVTAAFGDATLLGCGYTSDEPFVGERTP